MEYRIAPPDPAATKVLLIPSQAIPYKSFVIALRVPLFGIVTGPVYSVHVSEVGASCEPSPKVYRINAPSVAEVMVTSEALLKMVPEECENIGTLTFPPYTPVPVSVNVKVSWSGSLLTTEETAVFSPVVVGLKLMANSEL